MAYYMASVSWGKDSLAMLLQLRYENKPLNEVVFFDTGMEFQAIYNVRNAALGMLKVRGITYTELKPAKPFLYTMLDKPVKGRDRKGYGWCGGLCRWGTTEKLKALDRYAKSKNATVYIGIAADEQQRLERLEPYKIAPLATLWNMTEAECLQYCYDHRFYWYEDTDSEAEKKYAFMIFWIVFPAGAVVIRTSRNCGAYTTFCPNIGKGCVTCNLCLSDQ